MRRDIIEKLIRHRYTDIFGKICGLDALMRRRGLSILTDEALADLATHLGKEHRSTVRANKRTREFHETRRRADAALAMAAE